MKKILFVLAVASGMLLFSCNFSNEFRIKMFEKACQAGDLEKAEKIASDLEKHADKLTDEQIQRLITASLNCDEWENGPSDDVISEVVDEVGDVEEVEDGVTSAKTSVDIDAMLNQVESMLTRLSRMKYDSDEYFDLADRIDDLLDKIDTYDLSPAQERRIERLDDRFDEIEEAAEAASNAKSGLDDDDWDF